MQTGRLLPLAPMKLSGKTASEMYVAPWIFGTKAVTRGATMLPRVAWPIKTKEIATSSHFWPTELPYELQKAKHLKPL